ncbi:membrane protein [Paenibacillus sp. A3]|uniref:AI-2E family transporter n=1 Tax=Paenibacillus sp. A3 TaxID=1337054 RepID=UPI0006D54DFA|nr:AI-2E family transporter [Paenibacillus sp. A3]KPV58395.1 membrane protein [Paenibacillus sp. A3]
MNMMAFLQRKDVRRFGILALFCLLLFWLRGMLNLILLTFLMTFLMDRLHHLVHRWIKPIIPVDSKLLLSILYVLFVAVLVAGGFKVFPSLVHEVGQLIVMVKEVYAHPQNEIVSYLVSVVHQLDLHSIIKPGLDMIKRVGHWGFEWFLAFIMSLILLLSKSSVIRFTHKLRASKIGWLVEEIEYFGQKFVLTFGKVIETQLLIALINCVLTTIALWVMGFPNLFGLALLVFVLGLIPVAGVFVSLIPLCAIAFSLGGFVYVIYLIVTITLIHALEAYVLNPRLMASKTHLPIFYTFIVLLFSEHFFGIWGLIVGIPTFVFILDLLEVQTVGQPIRLALPPSPKEE